MDLQIKLERSLVSDAHDVTIFDWFGTLQLALAALCFVLMASEALLWVTWSLECAIRASGIFQTGPFCRSLLQQRFFEDVLSRIMILGHLGKPWQSQKPSLPP